MSHWNLQLTGGWLVTTAVIAAALAGLSLRLWRRSPRPRATLLMEALRLVIVALILLTLCRPELVRVEHREQKPQVVIVTDRSGSMETADVARPDGAPETRAGHLRELAARQPWAPLAQRYELAEESFGDAPSPDPAQPAGTDLNAALAALPGRYPNLRAVILLTDGDWNQGGSPVAAATRLAVRQTAIYAVGAGADQYLPDLVLDQVTTPAFCLLDEHVSIPFRVISRLPRPVDVDLELLANGRLDRTRRLRLPAFGQASDTILFHATALGDTRLTLRLPVLDEEAIADNNQVVRSIDVRQELLKVLVVESLPRWEYRFLRNALARDPGVDVDCLLLHPGLPRGDGADYIPAFPATRDLLAHYDVIFLGDVGVGPDGVPPDALPLIRGVVEQLGTGLVFLPGSRGRQLAFLNTPLDELLPVSLDTSKPEGIGLDRPSSLQLTTLGANHLLALLANSPAANRRLWRELPGFYWSAAVEKARPGASVLAVHGAYRNRYGHVPLLVTRPFGQGNVLFMGTDGAWRWRRGVEDVYHYRFWGQVVRWMAHPRHLAQEEGIRLVYSPESPRQGEEVTLHATVADASGYPATSGEVTADIHGEHGSRQRLRLDPVEGGWGVYRGAFTPRESGACTVTITAEAAGRRLETTIQVAARTLERVGQPANHAILRELARLTDGSFVDTGGIDDIVNRIRLLPEPEPRQSRFQLWSQWWWGLMLLGLLGAYWTLRKYYGFL